MQRSEDSITCTSMTNPRWCCKDLDDGTSIVTVRTMVYRDLDDECIGTIDSHLKIDKENYLVGSRIFTCARVSGFKARISENCKELLIKTSAESVMEHNILPGIMEIATDALKIWRSISGCLSILQNHQ